VALPKEGIGKIAASTIAEKLDDLIPLHLNQKYAAYC
jgi:hypothetical protein